MQPQNHLLQPKRDTAFYSKELGLTYNYARKLGKKECEKRYLQKLEKEKIIKKETLRGELIASGVEPTQAQSISDFAGDHPEIYESLEDTIEKRIRATNSLIIALSKKLESLELKGEGASAGEFALLIKALLS
ncbi:MAG: hypothetical protein ACRCYP_01365 [Alphaproteobacteria bacterium]